MTDVAEMTPIQSGKAKANTNADTAKGHALAKICVRYGEARMKAEEKEHGKLKMIVKSIQELARDGHAEFRAQLTAELNLLKAMRDSTGVTKAQTAGYSFNSFETLCSNWKTISTAVELGYDTTDKPWSIVVAESVQMREAHANNGAEGAQLPTKRKAGRKSTPLIDKAIKAAEDLWENNPEDFKAFAATIEKMLRAKRAEPAPF
jgi:hypothetical protein